MKESSEVTIDQRLNKSLFKESVEEKKPALFLDVCRIREVVMSLSTTVRVYLQCYMLF